MTYILNFHLDTINRRLSHSQYLRLKIISNNLENCQAKMNELSSIFVEDSYIIYYLDEGR